MRITVAVTVAMDGTKLPLLLVFKRQQGDRIQKILDNTTPPGIVCGVQEKARMGASMMDLWFEKVWKPYGESIEAESAILLGD